MFGNMKNFINKYKIVLIILIIIIFVIILGISYKLYTNNKQKKINEPNILCNIAPADKEIIINNLEIPKINTGLRFTLSKWIYVSDWNIIKNDKKRHIILWKNNKNGLSLYMDSLNNNLHCDWSINYENNKEHINSVIIEDISLQKWINIVIVLENRNLDIFIDGKLEKSKKINLPPILKKTDMIICPFDGFAGFISNVKYYNRAISKSEIKSIFNKGHKCSSIKFW